MPGGRYLSIPGFAPKVTTFRATLYAVLLGLSLRIEFPLKQNGGGEVLAQTSAEGAQDMPVSLQPEVSIKFS
jgi:hypothetical protein